MKTLNQFVCFRKERKDYFFVQDTGSKKALVINLRSGEQIPFDGDVHHGVGYITEFGNYVRPKDMPKWAGEALVKILAEQLGSEDQARLVVRLYQPDDLSRPRLCGYGIEDHARWGRLACGTDGLILHAVPTDDLPPCGCDFVGLSSIFGSFDQVGTWLAFDADRLREACQAAVKMSKGYIPLAYIEDDFLAVAVKEDKDDFSDFNRKIEKLPLAGAKRPGPVWFNPKLMIEMLQGLSGQVSLGAFYNSYSGGLAVKGNDYYGLMMGMSLANYAKLREAYPDSI